MDNNSTNLHSITDSIEHDFKIKKTNESILLLKRKMCKTHDLIKQYFENMKEIDYLKSNLDIAKKDAKHTISNYKSAMDKIRELELKIVEDKQRSEKLINKINEYEINVAADEQTIQQLKCKIKDMETEHSAKLMEYNLEKLSLEDKIKDLEHALKKSKVISIPKKKEKKIISTDFDSAKRSIGTKSSSDIGINISLCENELNAECEVQERSIMTNSKCEVQDKSIMTDAKCETQDKSIMTDAKCETQDKSIMTDVKCETQDKSIMTDAKCEIQDKSIMTDEFYNIKDDPYPLFCTKCEAHLPPDLTPEIICKTMSVYPKLIERNLSPLPKKIYSPPCSLPSTYLDSMNRNEDALSRISMSHSYSPYNDSIIGNSKSQSERSSPMVQICENIESRNVNVSRIPTVGSLSSNFGSIPTAFILSQNKNYAREDFSSNDLLAKHSLSIKEMERKIQLLEGKMKKFRKLKEKINNNSCCRCSTNCKDMLNSNLISIMCKSMVEYYSEKKEACSKNKREIDSEECTCSMKKTKLKQQLNKNSACKNTFSCKIGNCQKCQIQDTFCNELENATKTIDILQCEHMSSVHKNNSFSDINISSTSLNDIDKSDKREILHEKNTLHSAEVEDSLTTSRLSADEIYTNDNLLDKDNVEAIDINNKIKTGTIFLSNNEHSIDHADKIVDINAEDNIRNKAQNIHEDKADEIYSNDNLLNKENVKTIEMDETEIGMTVLSNNENSTDDLDEIVDINAEENIIKNKTQNIHEDKIDEIYASDNFLNKNNVKTVDMDETEIGTTVLSNNKNCTDHDYSKIIDINAEKNEIKSKSQDIHENEIGEIYSNDNLLNNANIKTIDTDQTETGTIVLSNNENSTSHTDDKIIDINAEKNKIKSKDQNVHKDKIGEIYPNDNLLNKENIKAIDLDNQIEIGVTVFNNENSTDDRGKIDDINAEKNIIKNKAQNIHEDKVDEIYASDNILDKNNVKTVDMDKTKIKTTVLPNNKNFTDHDYGKIIDINAEKNEIKSNKSQDIHENKIGEIYSNDNLLNKDNIKAIDTDQTETGTIVSSNNENCTDHAGGKIVDINVENNKIKSKDQNVHKDKMGEIYPSSTFLSKGNVKAIDTDQTETGTIVSSNNENSTDHADGKIVDINVENNKIKSKDQNVHKDKMGEIYPSSTFLSKGNVKAIDMDNQTETGTTVLSNNDNFMDDGKIVDINPEKNKIENKDQNIHNKIGEIYTNDNLLSKNNTEVIDKSNQTKTGKTSLSKDKNSIDHADSKIYINAEESKIKRKDQVICKGKVGDRLLKKIRNLKRKTQANSRVNKQDDIESCSEYSSEHNELSKRLRIENRKESDSRSLTSIINLKRKLDARVESTNKQDNKLCPDDYEPAKKLRIAHTPKTSVLQSSINENHFTHSTIRGLANLMTQKSNRSRLDICQKDNLLTTSRQSCTINKKYDGKNVKSIETNSIDKRLINEKDLDLTSAKNGFQNTDVALSAINITRISEKCNDVSIEDTINRSISMDKAIGEMSSNSNEPNVLHNNIASDTVNDLELEESIPSRTSIITQSQSSKDSKYNRLTEALETIETRKEVTPIAEIEYVYKELGSKEHDDDEVSKDAISNVKSSILHGRSNVSKATGNSHDNSNISDGVTEVLRSPSPRDSDTIVEDYTNDSNMKKSLDEIRNVDKREKACINNEIIGIRTRRKNVRMNQQDKETKFIDVSHEIEEESQTPMSRLIKYINEKHMKKKHKLSPGQRYIRKITDKFVKMQLQRLINSAWEETIHNDIIEKLKSTCGSRIIAKCIVEFLLEEVDHSEALDKSFTPPAPMMTTFEQKIITLLVDLEALKPTVIYFVQAAIEYNLFKLNGDVKIQHVNSLTRIYVVLSRIQKDREKIRMMCCDTLYGMGLKSIDVLYTILTSWPEVLPNAEANKELLPRCIASLISSQKIENAPFDMKRSLQKLTTLKTHILRYYKYTYQEPSDILNELMTALKAERIDGLDTAIILIAKKEKSPWTYKNIIESALLPMILKNEHPCVYSAFSLLGKLLRAFPLQDRNNIVKDIIEQLCDLIKSGQGSHDQQEGIISALLNLSRHNFNVIAPFVIKWMPSKSLRPATSMQLQTFMNTRNSKFWKKYLELLESKHIEDIG